jgi:hypothetical protein
MQRIPITGIDGKDLPNNTNIDTLFDLGIYYISRTTTVLGTLPPLELVNLGSNKAILYVDDVYNGETKIARQIWTNPIDVSTDNYYRLFENNAWTTWTTTSSSPIGDVYFAGIKGNAKDNVSLKNTLNTYVAQIEDNGQTNTAIMHNGTVINLTKADGGGSIQINQGGINLTGTEIKANGVIIPQSFDYDIFEHLEQGANITIEDDNGKAKISATGDLSPIVNFSDIAGDASSNESLVNYIASHQYNKAENDLYYDLEAGTGISITVNDETHRVRIANTGSGGGTDYYWQDIQGQPNTNTALTNYINSLVDLDIASTVNGSFMNHVLSAGAGITFSYDDVSHRLQISASGSSGGSSTWGSIGGNVVDQTDLIAYITNNRYRLSGYDMFNHIKAGSNIDIGLDPQTGDLIINSLGSGEGGSSVWGAITGDITNQKDLVAYVNDRAQYWTHERQLIHRFDAGDNIIITGDPDTNTIQISSTGSITSTLWGGLGGNIENQTDLIAYISSHKYNAQDLYGDISAGNNITINYDETNKKVIINATGGGDAGDVLWGTITGSVSSQTDLTMYISSQILGINGQFINSRLKAGTNIDLDLDPQTGNVVISAQAQITSSIPWGGITGDPDDQIDLKPYIISLLNKQLTGEYLEQFFVAGQNIVIDDSAGKMRISAQRDVPTGGTAGQVLGKDTDADYSLKWIDVNIPDIYWRNIQGVPTNNTALKEILDNIDAQKENKIIEGANISITRGVNDTATINAIVNSNLIASSLEAGANISIEYDSVNDKAKISASGELVNSVNWGNINGTLASQTDLTTYIANLTNLVHLQSQISAGEHITITSKNDKLELEALPYTVNRDATLLGDGVETPLSVATPLTFDKLKGYFVEGNNIDFDIDTTNEKITINAIGATEFKDLLGEPADNEKLKVVLDKKIEEVKHDTTITGNGVDVPLHAVIPTVNWNDIHGDISASVDLTNYIHSFTDTKQDKLTAGTGIVISSENVISVDIDTTNSFAEITGSPTDNSALTSYLNTRFDTKQDKLTAGDNINIINNTISATVPDTFDWTKITGDAGDNTSLVSYVDSELLDYQKKLTAGSNITIDSNNVISATNTTSLPWSSITGQVSTNQTLVDYIANQLTSKQDTLTAGTGITITDNTISATHQTPTVDDIFPLLSEGQSIDLQIVNGKIQISALDDPQILVQWQNIQGEPSTNSALTAYIESLITGDITPDMLLGKLEAGSNIQLVKDADKVMISATDTKYTAGSNITIDGNNVISAPAPTTSLPWTSITGTPTSNTELNDIITGINNDIGNKQNHLTAGTNITIDNNVISATATSVSFGDIQGQPVDNSALTTYLSNNFYTKTQVDQAIASAVANALAGITSTDQTIGVSNS